jgi:hypothetical protein
MFVIILPTVGGEMPEVLGYFGFEEDAHERGRELGGGHTVARFRFTEPPARVLRRRADLGGLAGEIAARARPVAPDGTVGPAVAWNPWAFGQ